MGRIIFSGSAVIAVVACAAAADFAVNTRTGDNQTHPAIAADANGNFVVAWSSYRQDGSSGGIFAQRFSADAECLGTEFRINATTAGNQTEPAVAMDVAGNFVVAWHGPGVIEEDIFARRFDANGQPLGGEFMVNTVTGSRQLSPAVAMNNDGDFVVVWESQDIPEIGKRAICAQLYNRSGIPVGGEFIINDQPATCRHPAVAMHRSGKFIVVWVKDSSSNSVWLRRFEPDGSAPYLSSKVSDSGFSSLTRPGVAIDPCQGHVVVWDGHADTYLEDDIYLKTYHWSGAPLHDDFVVNTCDEGAQSNPSVSIDDQGRFVIVWQGRTAATNTTNDIFGRRFDTQGETIGEPFLLGDEFRMNTYRADDQRRPQAVISNQGRFVTVWESYRQDGSGYGIFGNLGPPVGCADLIADGCVNFLDYCVLAREWLRDQNPLAADLVDDNRIDQQDLAALGQQWLQPCHPCSRVDINADGKIDMRDYALWAQDWPQYGPNLDGDITGDGLVDMADLRALAFYWSGRCQ